ncbi:MAG: hypothetical protein ABIJ21_08415 [Nanoarchaeota archaeon]
MKRSIVQHGSSSLTVTLPVKWVNKYRLKKGDELECDENGSTITFSCGKAKGTLKKSFSTRDWGIFTKHNISHLYHLGYDEIELHYEDLSTLTEIKERLPNLMGFEIIDQRKNLVIIKSIAAELEGEFDTLLRKSFQVTNEMATLILDAAKTGKTKDLNEVTNLEAMNNKFTDICVRILNKQGYSVQHRTLATYDFVLNLERIADEMKRLASQIKGKVPSDVYRDIQATFGYYQLLYTIFYKEDLSVKKRLYTEKQALLDKFITSMRKGQPIIYHHLVNIVQKTFEAFGAYAAMRL